MQLDYLVDAESSEACPALQVISLQDGMFKASIQLVNFPIGGNIVIRVSGYTLEFYWCLCIDYNIKRNSELFNVSSGMVYCKGVDLPMYVDMNQLTFTMNLENHLHVSASMKDFLGLPQKCQTSLISEPGSTVNVSSTKALSVGLCFNPCIA